MYSYFTLPNVLPGSINPPYNPFKGLAGIVPLDYGSRFEHSVIVVPEEWESLYHLMVSPEEVLEAIRAHYVGGVKDSQGNPVAGVNGQPWIFQSPMEISITPITLQSPRTLSILHTLEEFYPGFITDAAPPVVLAQSFATLASNMTVMAPETFAEEVIKAAGRPGANGFPLQYVAEFALETGILNILYVPRQKNGVHAASQSQFFNTNVTQLTFNRIHGSSARLVHFDLDFNDCNHTYEDVATRRAGLVFDFLNNPKRLITHIKNHRNENANKKDLSGASEPVQLATKALFAAGDLVDHTKTDLLQQTTSLKNFPKPSFIRGLPHPTAIIERVWPNLDELKNAALPPANQSTVNQLPPPPPPPPYPCVVAEYLDGKWVWIQVKSYV